MVEQLQRRRALLRDPRAPGTAAAAVRPRRLRPAPLVPLAVAAALGILADRACGRLGTTTWAALAAGAAVVALLVPRRERLERWMIVLACAALGGGWHHHRWSDLAFDDLARSIEERPRPAWLKGVLRRAAEFHPPESAVETGYTGTTLGVTAISDGTRWHAASGSVQLTISGDRSDLRAGDPVTAAGTLAAVAGPTNPGELDYRDRLRADGIRLRLSVGEPESVQHDPSGAHWPGTKRLGHLRAWSRARLTAGLDPAVAPLAAALLLGHREAVAPEIHDAFARTGTTHLLAISGLHLQALAAALLVLCRLLGIDFKPSCLIVLAGTAAYAVLVGGMPSVVRAAAMTATACLAVLVDRPTRPANLLAAAALVTLLLDPTDLFDTGCQLSFLAVAAILWGVPPTLAWLRRPLSPLDALQRRFEPGWRRAARLLQLGLFHVVVVSAVVWLVTLPLIALRFHLVSPIALLLNVPLVPMTSLALLLAGATLILSALWLPLAVPAAWASGQLLGGIESLVRWGVAQPWGHAFTAGPPPIWVLGFYLLLVLVALSYAGGWTCRWSLIGLGGAWLLALPALNLWASGPVDPELEVLDVGHGLAVVMRDAPGRASLYDCGRLGDARVGRRRIAPALWARGVRRLDQVILSHADSDHFSGLPDLLDRFPIGSVCVPPDFSGSDNPAAVRLLEQVRARGIPVRELAAGDRLQLGRVLTARVLHPERGALPGTSDNARSLVLELTSEGIGVVLTGDLDGPGLHALTALPPRAIAAWLAPHHGGRTANPPWLYDWARPRLVIVSQRAPAAGATDALAFLEDRGVTCLRTWRHGAVRLRWTSSGLEAAAFREPLDEAPPPRPAALCPLPSGLRTLLAVTAGIAANRWLIAGAGLILGILACAALAIVEWGAWALVRPAGVQPGPLEPPPWQPLTVTAADGTVLAGAWLGPEHANGRTALLLHGFGEDRSALRGRGAWLAGLGWNVVLIDARGRGRSAGRWTSFGACEAADLRAWLDHLERLQSPAFLPIAWGRSMGAAIALRAAVADRRLRAVVLEAPYAELRASVAGWLRRRHLPGILARWLLRRAGRIVGAAVDQPAPIDLAPRLRVPALVLYGTDDPVVPAAELHRLVAAFEPPPTVLEVPGARHNDVFDQAGADLAERIARFLEDAAALPPEIQPRPAGHAPTASTGTPRDPPPEHTPGTPAWEAIQPDSQGDPPPPASP